MTALILLSLGVFCASGGAAWVLGPMGFWLADLFVCICLPRDPVFRAFSRFRNVQKVSVTIAVGDVPVAASVFVRTGEIDRIEPFVFSDDCGD